MMLSIESSFLTNDMYSSFYDIHSVVTKKDPRISSPRHFIKLINSFRTIFIKKRTKVIDRQKHLKVKWIDFTLKNSELTKLTGLILEWCV